MVTLLWRLSLFLNHIKWHKKTDNDAATWTWNMWKQSSLIAYLIWSVISCCGKNVSFIHQTVKVSAVALKWSTYTVYIKVEVWIELYIKRPNQNVTHMTYCVTTSITSTWSTLNSKIQTLGIGSPGNSKLANKDIPALQTKCLQTFPIPWVF